jgi:septum site-determining protein MinC
LSTIEQRQHNFHFRGRSFIAFALSPEPPIADWLVALGEWAAKSPGFFFGRPVVLDLAAVTLSEHAIAHLIDQMAERGIRIMGLTGVDPTTASEKLPPVLNAGWGSDRPISVEPKAVDSQTVEPAPAEPAPKEPASLLLDEPVRSGQSVHFPFGDVTILGSVASGAEVIAGGSIHIYGTLRGTAMAGTLGDDRARIFCSRNEAELLAINGYYKTAEDMPVELRSRPAQAWLESDSLMITTLV